MFLEQRQNDLPPLDPAFVYSISYFQIQPAHNFVSHSSAACHAEHLQQEGEGATVCLSTEIRWGGSWLSQPLLGAILKGWSKVGQRGCGAWRRGRCMFTVNAC